MVDPQTEFISVLASVQAESILGVSAGRHLLWRGEVRTLGGAREAAGVLATELEVDDVDLGARWRTVLAYSEVADCDVLGWLALAGRNGAGKGSQRCGNQGKGMHGV